MVEIVVNNLITFCLGGRKTTANIGLAICRLKCFDETFVQGSAGVILVNFCAEIPPPSPNRKTV